MPVQQPTETSAITAPNWEPYVASVEGRFAEASNATLLGETAEGERVVYKPVAGIQPLWDFEAATLPAREVWTYRIDQSLGSGVVPETAMGDGVYGPGAVQRFVDATADAEVVTMVNEADPRLWPISVLDLVTNNADRKAGHILRGEPDEIWAIDHGLTFHDEPKIRTILWGFAGLPVPQTLLTAATSLLEQLGSDLGAEFAADLSTSELNSMRIRIERLLHTGVHPEPPEHRPAIPWPPY